MNQIYVILGAPFWRACGKRVGLWYAHGAVTGSLRLAVRLADTVFTSTAQGMRIDTPKRRIVGQGIDPNQFTAVARQPAPVLRLITIGRVSPSKNIDTLLQAAALLKSAHVPFTLTIIGGTSTPAEAKYATQMQSRTADLALTDDVTWVGPQPHDQLPTALAQADLFIHDGSTNSLDKALVEAAFAGCTVISSNPSYRALTQAIAPDLLFAPKDHHALAQIISVQATQPSQHVCAVRDELLQTCSLPGLVSGIVSQI